MSDSRRHAPSPTAHPPRHIVALVRDLMFSSRIAATARAANVPLTLIRDPARLAIAPVPASSPASVPSDVSTLSPAPDPVPAPDADLAANPAPALLLVDLNLPGAIDAALQWKQASPAREVVGFVSHVDAVTIAHARGAGLDRILPRSRFVEQLPELLA